MEKFQDRWQNHCVGDFRDIRRRLFLESVTGSHPTSVSYICHQHNVCYVRHLISLADGFTSDGGSFMMLVMEKLCGGLFCHLGDCSM